MDYETFVMKLAEQTGQDPQAVRLLMAALPQILMDDLGVGESVQTPLGTFKKKRRASKKVRSIRSQKWIDSTPKDVVTLKPGSRLIELVETESQEVGPGGG